MHLEGEGLIKSLDLRKNVSKKCFCSSAPLIAVSHRSTLLLNLERTFNNLPTSRGFSLYGVLDTLNPELLSRGGS